MYVTERDGAGCLRMAWDDTETPGGLNFNTKMKLIETGEGHTLSVKNITKEFSAWKKVKFKKFYG